MAVIKEWQCPRCGDFESAIPACIYCGSTEVKRVFLTPPAFKSDKTKMVDDSLRTFARQTGRTDYSNNLSTRHEVQSPNIWAPNDGRTDISKFVGGGINVQEAKANMPGQYEKIVHADDLKGAA